MTATTITRDKQTRRPEGRPGQPLCWCGWSLRLPQRWRPLRIEGGWDEGMIMLGDADMALLQVKWQRPRSRRFNGRRWTERRARRATPRGGACRNKPAGIGFDHVAFIPEARAPKGQTRGLWFGWSEQARLAVEMVLNNAAPKRDRRRMVDSVVPSIAADLAKADSRWAIYGGSFTVPGGYRLKDIRLHLGDLVLRFEGDRRDWLTLRQLYPSDLALGRRKLVDWLTSTPFPCRRRWRTDGNARQIALAIDGAEQPGVRIRGSRRYRFPLGGWFPRYVVSEAVHDETLGRCLIAELSARRPQPPVSVVEKAIQGMNWALDRPEGST